MNRRRFLTAVAAVPAVLACPALAKAPTAPLIFDADWTRGQMESARALLRGELGHWENVRIITTEPFPAIEGAFIQIQNIPWESLYESP
jgi:hypothetical protein